jgi:outer membrane lipoprotein-sorting protein
MHRRILLPGLALAAMRPRPLAAQQGSIDAAAIRRAEAYLNGLVSLQARFLQIDHRGRGVEGRAAILRPARMRFDYDPPEPVLLVASGGQVMLLDRELGQPSIAPANATPLGMLLRDPVRFSGDVAVLGTDRSGGFLRITLARAGALAEGRLTLVFEENPMQLRQWAVLDAQARETRVTLTEIDTQTRPSPALFDFNDPRFLEREGIRPR